MDMRVLKVLTGVAILLSVAIVVVFAFGTPQAPAVVANQNESAPLEPGAAAPGSAGQGIVVDQAAVDPSAPRESEGGDQSGMGAADPTAEAPEADPSSPLAIQIPGCVCHSDDPKEVERHAEYRMNQCAGCHMGSGAGQ